MTNTGPELPLAKKVECDEGESLFNSPVQSMLASELKSVGIVEGFILHFSRIG